MKMLSNAERERYNTLSEQVIAAAFEVSNELGSGFLEKVYENALVYELQIKGLRAEAQKPIPVCYKGRTVGDYYADILVENTLSLELKCAESFADEHVAQCINYLRATRFPLALLINFQKAKVEVKRIVNGF